MKDSIRKFEKAIFDHVTIQAYEDRIASFHSDLEHVRYRMELCCRFNIVPAERQPSFKSEVTSKKWRDAGNRVYVSCGANEQRLQDALMLYSTSLAHAPLGSESIAIILANRSAPLLKLHRYRECLRNLDSCLALDYPEALRVKALLRRTECLAALRSADAKSSYEDTLRWIEQKYSGKEADDLRKRLQQCYGVLVSGEAEEPKYETDLNILFGNHNLVERNPEAAAGSAALVLRYNKAKGRHLVANRDIRAGDILVREAPYLAVYQAKARYAYCWMCLGPVDTGVPCETCAAVIYCSDECKRRAWREFHDVECAVLPVLLTLRSPTKRHFGVASLRALIRAVKELGSLEKLKDEVGRVEGCKDPRTKGFAEDGKFYSDKYRSFYSLVNNTNVTEYFIIYASFIAYYLATDTDFFGKRLPKSWSDILKNEQVIFAGSLLFRHIQILFANGTNDENELNDDIMNRSLLIYPFSSMINHSCFPNVHRLRRSDDQLVYAMRHIKKGEEIVISYNGCKYFTVPRLLRQELLQVQYNFTCKCTACTRHWPMGDPFRHNIADWLLVKLFTHYFSHAFVDKLDALKALLKYLCDETEAEVKANFPRFFTILSDVINDMTNCVEIRSGAEDLFFLQKKLNSAFETSQKIVMKKKSA